MTPHYENFMFKKVMGGVYPLLPPVCNNIIPNSILNFNYIMFYCIPIVILNVHFS